MAQRTFSIVKPDAVRKGFTGGILAEIDKAGFKNRSHQKAVDLKGAGRGFLLRTQGAAFLRELTTFMSSRALVLMVRRRKTPLPICAS